MDWNERIVSDKNILLGKPTIKGTRISVEFLLERLANGWTEEKILSSYPHLNREDIQAVFAYHRPGLGSIKSGNEKSGQIASPL